MKHILVLSVVLMVAGSSLAQSSALDSLNLPERLFITRQQYVGSGARSLGLGGTYTGIADDYSSVWWNPAGLAQIKRIEMQGSLSRVGYSAKTDYFGGVRDGSTTGTRLNNIGIVFPVPVYQGALSFAFGYNQVGSYDRRNRVQTTDPSSPYSSYDELEGGRLGFWTFAGAADVSPNLALGMGLNYWTGVDEYTWTGTDRSGNYSEQSITTDLSSWGLNLGALYRIGRFARFGGMYQTPMSLSLKEEFESHYANYRMTYPAVYRLGASVSPGRWLLGADVEYRDWTSMEFRSEPPIDSIGAFKLSKAIANQKIKDEYQDTWRVSVGGEYMVPSYGVRLRAGYSFEPSNYKQLTTRDDRSNISFGVGLLLDRDVMFDAAFQFASFNENPSSSYSRDISATTALVTISYRM